MPDAVRWLDSRVLRGFVEFVASMRAGNDYSLYALARYEAWQRLPTSMVSWMCADDAGKLCKAESLTRFGLNRNCIQLRTTRQCGDVAFCRLLTGIVLGGLKSRNQGVRGVVSGGTLWGVTGRGLL